MSSTGAAAQGKTAGSQLVRAGAAAFAVVIASWLVFLVASGRSGALNMVDLTVYRDGGLIVRHVTPYYDPAKKYPLYDWDGYGSQRLQFTYTPFAAIAFALLSFIPTTPLDALSVIGNIICLPAALWFTFGALGYRDRRVRLGVALLAAAATFWLQPVVRTIYLGQINLILMAAIMWDLTQPDHTKNGKYRWWKGVATGVAAGIKLTPLIFVPYLLVARKWREAAGCVGGFLATVVVGFLVLPHDSSEWWLHGAVISDGNRTGFAGWAGDQSLHGLLTRLTGSIAGAQTAWVLACVLAVILGIGTAYLLDRAGYPVPAVLVTALTGLLVSPISWDHHWVWIALGIAVAAHYAIDAWRRGARGVAGWLWAAVAGMIFIYYAWPDALFTHVKNLGNFSLGLLWLQKNTNPLLFQNYGDQPWYVEYHWHGFQLIWGNAYILGGMALLLFLLAIAFRLRNATPPSGLSPQPSVPAAVQPADGGAADAGAADEGATTAAAAVRTGPGARPGPSDA